MFPRDVSTRPFCVRDDKHTVRSPTTTTTTTPSRGRASAHGHQGRGDAERVKSSGHSVALGLVTSGRAGSKGGGVSRLPRGSCNFLMSVTPCNLNAPFALRKATPFKTSLLVQTPVKLNPFSATGDGHLPLPPLVG